MLGAKPQKASAFAIVTRRDGAIYCTVEAHGLLGLGGGKHDPEADGDKWRAIVEREFEEEIGVPLPPAIAEGYLEWGSARYQIRFLTLLIDDDEAATLPANTRLTSDPDGAVTSARWVTPAELDRLAAQKRVRPHVATALRMVKAMKEMRRELYYGDPVATAQQSAELEPPSED